MNFNVFKSIKPVSSARNFALVLVAGATIGGPLTLENEGMRLKPYYDSVGVKTVCAGETEYVEDRSYSNDECVDLYGVRYGYYSLATGDMYNDKAKEVITPQIHAAMTDMSYNVGIDTVKKSSMIRYLNQGKPVAACEAIKLYKKAGGRDCSLPANKKICGGIWDRRLKMNKLCLRGTQ